jgi:hypothetical protein
LIVCFFVAILFAPAAAAAAAAISCAVSSFDLVRECSVVGTGADAVLSAYIDAAEVSSKELSDDSVVLRALLGRTGDFVGDVTGSDFTLVGVMVRSCAISAEAFDESIFT